MRIREVLLSAAVLIAMSGAMVDLTGACAGVAVVGFLAALSELEQALRPEGPSTSARRSGRQLR